MHIIERKNKMTKEEIIKKWIDDFNGVVDLDTFTGDKNDPPFFLVYINSLNRYRISDLSDMVFPVRLNLRFDLKTQAFEELEETIKEPFIPLTYLFKSSWLETMMGHLYESYSDNYFSDGNNRILTVTDILKPRQTKDLDICWIDLVHVKMRVSTLQSYEDSKVLFGLYRIYNNFGGVCGNFNASCSETYDQFIKIKKSLKDELKNDMRYIRCDDPYDLYDDTSPKFVDLHTVSLKTMYYNITKLKKED